jgi:sarcosine oxidase
MVARSSALSIRVPNEQRTMTSFDAAIIGLGVMGSAALAALARRGRRVVGIDRFAPGHDRGSSHGGTRVFRIGYFEHPSYVPLLRTAYPLWRELEARSGQSLITVTGILEMGAQTSALVAGTLQSARLHRLPHEILDAAGVATRFPAFRLPPDFVGVFQPDGGFVRAEPAVAAFQGLARQAGADLRMEERVLAIMPDGAGVRVTTERGEIVAGGAIVAAGAWLRALLPQLPVPLRVTRQVVAWFEPAQEARASFAAEHFPVFLLQNHDGVFYGFPLEAAGVKVAKHHHLGEAADPDHHDRTVSTADEAVIRHALKAYLPDANGPLLGAQTCLYTMAPDGDFIIDRMPGYPQIIVASPCSGHGFKFAPVLGEILADLAMTGSTDRDISRFSLSRFAAA